jgi:hypothetical protein
VGEGGRGKGQQESNLELQYKNCSVTNAPKWPLSAFNNFRMLLNSNVRSKTSKNWRKHFRSQRQRSQAARRRHVVVISFVLLLLALKHLDFFSILAGMKLPRVCRAWPPLLPPPAGLLRWVLRIVNSII